MSRHESGPDWIALIWALLLPLLRVLAMAQRVTA